MSSQQETKQQPKDKESKKDQAQNKSIAKRLSQSKGPYVTENREFQFGKQEQNQETSFCRNFITTSKYTIINFLPKCLLLQFKRYANIYFLIIAILQSISEISPLHPFAAWTPLIFVIALSMVREGIEDLQRHKSDVELNSSECKVYDFQQKNFAPKLWSEVLVGDFVKVMQNETFPTDLVVIKSSAEDGACFIETSSLDGEKNLKPKLALTETLGWCSESQPRMDGVVSCIPPDQDLYKFEGTLVDSKKNKIVVDENQFLLRGSRLKNTQWIIGIVCYTGSDTKIMKNADKSKFKQSNIEKITNRLILVILIFQFCVSLCSALGYGIWHANQDDHYYLHMDSSPGLYAVLTFFTYVVLNNTMIPISLIVSLEIVKAIQGYLIQSDEEMYCAHKEKGPKVFTTSINEELGQIEYIFSDKTGTLTCNIMEFKLLMVGADLFGNFDVLGSNNQIANVEREKRERIMPKMGIERRQTQYIDQTSEIAVNNIDKTFVQLLNLDQQKHEKFVTAEFNPFEIWNSANPQNSYKIKNRQQLAQEILLLLASCHECVVEQNDEDNQVVNQKGNVNINVIREDLRYQGPSPDEVTLVDIARHFGYVFLKKTSDKISLQIWKNLGIKDDNSEQEMDLLLLFPFNSDRKRMSVIVRHEGKIKLFIKGADNMILERLNKKQDLKHKQQILNYIDEFSKKGLRTLLLAMKVLEEDEFKQYYKEYQDLADAENRDKGKADLAERIETDLTLLGATAVEDKLQENVPETIRDMLLAKIKVWMLTGDKMETAENIARSCKLIQPEFEVMSFLPQLNAKKEATKKSVDQELQAKIKRVEEIKKQEGVSKALLIEGQYLQIVLSEESFKDKLIEIIQNCEAVVCCRATPKQKAQVVKLVKDKLNKITLAIGDGANDVNMIQEAHIGVGLYGQEGMRAVQASDYALPEFQQLWRLVLVHGRWSYLRISEMILYFFYKNFIFTIPQFYFSFSCAFSGQTIFDDWYITLYNIIFTALPLIIRAITEQDVYFKQERYNSGDVTEDEGNNSMLQPQNKTQKPSNEKSSDLQKYYRDERLVKQIYPKLYYIGQQKTIFNMKNFLIWMVQGMSHAGLIYFFHIMVIHKDQATDIDGYSPDIWFLSISMYTSIIFIVNLKLMIHTQYWTIITFITMMFTSFFSYIIYIFIASEIESFSVYMTSTRIVYSPDFYLTVALCVGLVFAFDAIVLYFKTFEKSEMVEFLKYVIKNDRQHTRRFMKLFKKQDFHERAIDISFGSIALPPETDKPLKKQDIENRKSNGKENKYKTENGNGRNKD